MKKAAKILIPILVVLLIGGIIGGYVAYNLTYHPSKWLAEGDDAFTAPEDYQKTLETLPVLENTWQEALPQTAVYDLIKAHFASPLPAGKTEKKAIVIGYDGCQVDTFRLLATAKKSAINTLLQDGGHAIFTYAGGVNFPAENTQATSTAPGWCSMLTGQWADVHGVTDNDIPKSNDHLTLLTTAVEDGTIGSSAFYVSWDGHFNAEDSTYAPEKQYVEEKGLPVHFVDAGGDDGTVANVLADISAADCSDFIFTILEYPDHTGHDTGFCPDNPEYVQAFLDADAAGAGIIDAIEARPTYDAEDWLILITSDHGGFGTGHGLVTLQERMTFIVLNGELALDDARRPYESGIC